jgi:ATP-dependent Clp protease adaptor protein ClpS
MTKITENNHSDNQTLLNEDVKQKIKKPSMYKVLMLNDDYTPMDFVVFLLKKIFGKSDSEATDIMLNIHKNGSGLCGYYSYEIAETKTLQVIKLAKANEHPLQCIFEKK